MTWTAENSRSDEASKIRWELVPYMNGRCLDIGCGLYKVFPHFVGIDNGHHWGARGVDVKVDTAEKLPLIADESCDCVFSSHLLEHIDYEDVPDTLKEWMRVLKKGGHLCLYLPDEEEYPKVGEPGANTDHKWNVSYQKIVESMEKMECDWDLTDFQKRNQDDEYSIFFVFKKYG